MNLILAPKVANLINQLDKSSCWKAHKKFCNKSSLRDPLQFLCYDKDKKDVSLGRTTMRLNKKCPFVCYPHTSVHCLSSHTTRCAQYPWSVTAVTLTVQDRLPVTLQTHLFLFYTEETGCIFFTKFLSIYQAARY